ncbi:TadE/TadG family type IV pilus assembly protein [Embleya sp. NPDC020886]|uniref:TadE/TadG family type IV pilus assembly protein n=1 Tax=Embleya sp. NPDC020886 TaxID=3363980 RepID=UPI0037B99090
MYRGSLRADEGSFALEAAVLAPVLIAFLCLVIAFGRTTLAGNGVDAAAKAGAREASIARNASDAESAARAAVVQSLDQDGIACAPVTHVDITGFATDVGKAATVTVSVTCKVSLSDVAFPGIPGSKTMNGTFTSVIDTYRERSK